MAFLESRNYITEADSLTIRNSSLEIPEYLIIQSNSLLPVSNLASLEGKKLIRTVTAYYPVPWQTDDEPCISASGMNICETTKKICASNEFPFGTKFLINDEIWEVQDRMNPRYNGIIDLFFKDKESVQRWGKRTIEIIRLKVDK